MSIESANITPRQALRINRIIWAALVMGLLVGGVVLGLVVGPSRRTAEGDSDWLFTAIPYYMIFTMVPIGLFLRGQAFKRGWVGHAVTPHAYASGNLLAWACCEGPAFTSLIFYFISAKPLALVPYALGVVMLILLFPNGKALLPHPPEGAANPYESSH